MKATDYLEKWYDKLINAGDKENEILADILMDFSKEMSETCKLRNIHKEKAFISLLKEQSQKYNKFCRLVNEKLEYHYLKENGLKKFWINQNPKLEKIFNSQEGSKAYMKRTCVNCYWSRNEGYKPYKVWCVINHIMTVANKNRCKCNSWKRSLEGR